MDLLLQNETGRSQTVKRLLTRIFNILTREEYELYPGLLTGNSGIILFLARYYKYVTPDDEALKRIGYLLDKVFVAANTIQLAPSFASGYSGIAWLLFHLRDLEIVEYNDYKDAIDQLLDEVRESLATDLRNNEYDVLYGFAGKYFHYRNDKSIKAGIESWLQLNTHRTASGVYVLYEGQVNLGLAHGLPGIGLFILQHDFPLEYAMGLGHFLVSSGKALSRGAEPVSIFPNTLEPGQPENSSVYTPSRYAWCYGDPGILLFLATLYQTGNNPEVYSLMEVLTDSCNRRDLTNGHIAYLDALETFDIGFCHGLCGIVHLHKKINALLPAQLKLTNEKYWKDLLVQETDRFIDAFSLLKPATATTGEVDLLGLLEGLAGAGVVLIDELYEQNSLIPWDTLVTTL